MSRFRVVVPASTSNLGPGFDCLGLALDRHVTLEWIDGDARGLVVEGERPPVGFGDLLDAGLAPLGLPEGGTLVVHSRIPVGRGLGSSAALRIGLEVVRGHVAGGECSREGVLEAVVRAEGHPDNAAPALYGGLVVATVEGDRTRVTPAPISDAVGWAFASPSVPASTGEMRRALPSKIPHAVAARAVGRMAQLLPALASGDGEAIGWAMRDELHVPYRLDRIAGAAGALDAALEAGAWGCTLSGAGSGLVAAAPPDRVERVAHAMAEALRAVDPDPEGVVSFTPGVAREGARWGALSPG